MGSIKQIQVTFDCAEPQRVAQFWSEVLGYETQPETDGSWSACNDPSGVGPRLFFQRVPESKTVKNRVHLDVRAGTGMVGRDRLAALQAERARLEAIGAVCVRVMVADEENESCIVMQDVEGNEFCLD
ncbi:hypothetical protein SAMN04488564_1044 [Lentzea waywayandensis]|uniref:Glyoxalase-like domain-containing protein n=1 Tax=Lentzea waywayandensis TaxID=84724 RepID=A0A1I6EBE5_9PSEU|nr:VOC family protein [Lentzea waywayandensis]SFR14818.1 hypothetical protein SAMN04488564_1044 [Lentzea waywayandensis]